MADIDICERMGWTLTELDEQDMARVLPGLQLKSLIERLRQIEDTIAAGHAPDEDQLEVYELVKRYMDNPDDGR